MGNTKRKPESKQIVKFFLMAYPAGVALVYLFFASLPLAVFGGLACVFFLPLYEQELEKQRQQAWQQAFRDFLYFVSSALGAGHQMRSALVEAQRNMEMIYGAQDGFCQSLRDMNKVIGEHHQSEDTVLKEFAEQSGLEDMESFAEIYALCRELGGNTEEIIGTTGRVLSDKLAIMREIHTMTAQKQFEGRIIAVMPIAVILGLNLFYPEYIGVLYDTLSGRLLMSVSLVGILAAFLLLRHLTEIEV